MPSIKLTKTAVETAKPERRDYELRDTVIPGFLCKVTPAGRKVFMLTYRTPTGERRKPSLGTFGQLTVEQARKLAQDHLAAVRGGADPSQERQAARGAPTVKELTERFMTEYVLVRNRPSTARGHRYIIKNQVLPTLGRLRAADVKRPDIADLMGSLRGTPGAANQTLSLLRKMFNLAEIWGLRPDGTNPCRHVQKYGGEKRTRLITDVELARLFAYLETADIEGLEHPILTLAIRLQFEFAARMSEILELKWEWLDFQERRVVWPDSKTGSMSKPLSEEAIRLLRSAPRYLKSEYVTPALFDGSRPMPKHTYSAGWRRILERAGVPHCGTHAVRHRSATDIANSGVPVKVGMALTAHKTVTMFMRYVHTEDEPIRAAAEAVSARRSSVISGMPVPSVRADRVPDRLEEIDAEDTEQNRKRLLQSGRIQGLSSDSENILDLFDRRGLLITRLPPNGTGFVIGSMPIVRTAVSLEQEDGEAWLPINPRMIIGPGMAKGSVTLAEFDPGMTEHFNRIVANQSRMFGGPDIEQIQALAEWRRVHRGDAA